MQSPPLSSLRIGHGYDLHRLEPRAPAGSGRPLILGGLPLESERGPISHSDGDAVLHAVTDAILGAMGEPDIGQLFPDSAPENAGRDSADFLREASGRMRTAGLELVNVDITLILERPKVSTHKADMIASIARLLGIRAERVNLKGKTHEGVDAVGRGEAVEVHCVALLAPRPRPRPE